jgi:hypothetical protein
MAGTFRQTLVSGFAAGVRRFVDGQQFETDPADALGIVDAHPLVFIWAGVRQI